MVNTPDCGSGMRGFEPHQSPHRGVAKSVRHGTLTPACVGSSPAAPAIIDPLAQSVEHLTFNQGVPRSSRGWITICYWKTFDLHFGRLEVFFIFIILRLLLVKEL